MPLRAWLASTLLFASTALAADGAVEGVVFTTDGGPASGVVVQIGPVELTTDEDGAFRANIETGTVTVRVGESPIEGVDIVDGQTTELLVTLDANGSVVDVVLEEPESARVDQDEVGDPGTVKGTVRDAEGNPVEGARVFARGTPGDAYTDGDGVFTLEVPAGEWDVSVLKSGFATRTLNAVPVQVDQTVEVEFTLVEAGVELDEFVITAPKIVGGTADLLEERRDSSAVADMIGAEQMAKSGDSNAASALRRVTGLTVVGGRYVYVRGLGERYSSTLLNGASLPSPEPERRVVPLDLFPAGVIESVMMQKTFSPNMPAEFGGGTIQLENSTRAPKPFFQIGVSGTYNTQTTWQDGLTYQGGKSDWLGMDNGFRSLPGIVKNASDNQPLEEADMFNSNAYTADELEAFGEAMPNRWKISRRTVPLNYGLSLSTGTRIELGKHTFGVLAGGTYADEWAYNEYPASFTFVSGGKVQVKHAYDFEGLNRRVKMGGLATASWLYDDSQEVTGLIFLSRITDNETRIYEGYNDDVGSDIRVSRLRWIERQLLTGQLLGEHTFFGDHGITAKWRFTSSTADRIEPDRRETRFDLEENTRNLWLLSDRPEGNQRFFSTLDDQATDIGADLLKPIKLGKEQDLRLGAGGTYVRKIRTVDSRRFKYMHKGPLSRDDAVLSQANNPEKIFSPENIGNDGFQFEEITLPTDNYAASHTMTSVYGMVDVDLTKSTRIMTGARMEDSAQRVLTFELFNPDGEPILAELNTNDVLPAATLTQGLPADMQLRAGYGKTVSRPDFREMSPATFNDVTGGRQTFGNPELLRATIDNFDLRWEWYPSPGESMSVAGFAKNFSDPIEQIVISSAQQSVTYANAKGARNVGIELDWRKNFGFVGDAVQDVYFAGNLALIRSRVQLGQQDNAVQTNNNRALQGQSPYSLNLQLGYDHPEGRQNFAVLYNQFGSRIIEAGASGAPDTLEVSYGTLDLVGSTKLPGGFRLGLKAKNLTDPGQNKSQGRLIVEENSSGRELGLTLQWRAEKK